jgi:hypothetical protein
VDFATLLFTSISFDLACRAVDRPYAALTCVVLTCAELRRRLARPVEFAVSAAWRRGLVLARRALLLRQRRALAATRYSGTPTSLLFFYFTNRLALGFVCLLRGRSRVRSSHSTIFCLQENACLY